MQKQYICPITNKPILEYDCYEVCMVALRAIKQTILSKEFTEKKDFREICLKCPHHAEQFE